MCVGETFQFERRGMVEVRGKGGVLLALASHIALINISDVLAMQIVLSLAGILVLIAAATLLSSISVKPKQATPLA
jgi:hypothetical protein